MTFEGGRFYYDFSSIVSMMRYTSKTLSNVYHILKRLDLSEIDDMGQLTTKLKVKISMCLYNSSHTLKEKLSHHKFVSNDSLPFANDLLKII